METAARPLIQMMAYLIVADERQKTYDRSLVHETALRLAVDSESLSAMLEEAILNMDTLDEIERLLIIDQAVMQVQQYEQGDIYRLLVRLALEDGGLQSYAIILALAEIADRLGLGPIDECLWIDEVIREQAEQDN